MALPQATRSPSVTGPNTDTAGSTFRSEKGLAREYLRKLEKHWDDARILGQTWDYHKERLDRTDATRLFGHPDEVLIKIIDLQVDGAISSRAALTRGVLSNHSPTAVDNFLELQSVRPPGLHTRILLLPKTTLNFRAELNAWLLYIHILCCEGLGPANIGQLMTPMDGRDGPIEPSWFLPELTKSALTLRPPFTDCTEGIPTNALYVGTRDNQDTKPSHLVVMTMPITFEDHKLTTTFYGFRAPPPALEADQYATTIGGSRSCTQNKFFTPNTSALDLFEHCLRTAAAETVKLRPEHPTGCWLAAILSIATMLQSTQLEDLSRIALRLALVDGTQLRGFAEFASEQLEGILSYRENHPNTPASDYEGELRLYRQMVERAQRYSRRLQDKQDRDLTAQSFHMAQLQIKESRSAIALTILAFFFVPISLASSVFGMNVQEINHTGHSIWIFVYASLALLAISLVSWLAWRSVRNLKLLYTAARDLKFSGQTWDKLDREHKWRWLSYAYGETARYSYGWRRILEAGQYTFGFRDIEKPMLAERNDP